MLMDFFFFLCLLCIFYFIYFFISFFFTPCTDTMRCCSAQQDHLGVFNYVIDCVNFKKMQHHCHDWHK